tara:strand:- start:112 stop:291 length:180 start_codon:yes stop_codon:yes gene_type:complete
MQNLKLTFLNTKTKLTKMVNVQSLKSDSYLENGFPDITWLTFLSEKQVNLKGFYLHSID